MSDRQRVQTAFTMGNIGLWTQLREQAEVDDRTYDRDDGDFDAWRAGDGVDRTSWWQRVRGRVLWWSMAAGIVLAYVNHWPGGQ